MWRACWLLAIGCAALPAQIGDDAKLAPYHPTPDTLDFGNLPLYYLAKLDARYYADAAHCELCKRGVALEKVWL